MAIRQIRTIGDEILTKPCREVDEINDRILSILDDMKDTMYQSEGVGLAAPQIGILRRLVVMDVGEGLIEMINPKIIETSGQEIGTEGCLSVPGKYGEVERPMNVVVEAQDREGKMIRYEGSGLFARCACHEIDHLDGKLYVSLAKTLYDSEG